MGKVYRARVVGAAGFEKIVALKFVLPRKAGDSDAVRMFQEEARLAATLSHANIVGIQDFGVRGGNWYLAMEYVSGVNLRVLLERAQQKAVAIPATLAAFIAAEAARGLNHAHSRVDAEGKPAGIVHRDVSPQNIAISWNGEVKILDFGIALAKNRAPDSDGVVRGKFAYMSPEQALGEPLDFRTDIFSLGSILYEMTTGVRPFAQAGMKAALAVSMCEFERPDRLPNGREFPTRLVSIILRAMARDAHDRYLSAGDMTNELTQWIAEQRARSRSNEDESAQLAKFVGDLFAGEAAETTDGHHDRTYTDAAFSEDGTQSGDEEWVPPSRAALIGPSSRYVKDDAAPTAPRPGAPASPGRVSGSFQALAPPEPPTALARVPVWAWPAGALVLAAVAGGAVIATHHPPASTSPTPTAVVRVSSTPVAVASTTGALALATPVATASVAAKLRHIGLLYVSSVPSGAKVFLDGTEISDTPALIPDLGVPKHYSIEVRKEGFAFFGREVDLVNDDRIEVVAKLTPPEDVLGHVTFEIPEGLEVIVDGRSAGKGPTTVTLDGQPGPHQVHVHASDGRLVKDFTLLLRAGETTMLSVSGS